MRAHLKARVEAAFAPDAAAERDRHQRAVEAIAPLVIDADVLVRVAGKLAADQRAAMRTTIDKCFDRARLVAVEDDRDLADIGRPEISRLRDFAVEAEIAPHRPAKDPLLLAGIEFGVVIKAVGHPAV